MKNLKILIISSFLFLGININEVFSQSQLGIVYQCAPCGCDDDGKHFDKPGNCPSCGMKLEATSKPYEKLKKLDKKLNVAILIYHHAQVLDYAGPYDIFSAANKNFNVYTVAENREEIITMPNLTIKPEYDFNSAPKPDILVIPGGMWHVVNEKTKEWIKAEAQTADKLLSICTGAFILAEMGLLDGLEATTHSAGLDQLESNYPNISKVHRGIRFFDNGKIITSAGVTAGMDASFYLVGEILGQDWLEAVKTNLEYLD